MSFPIQNKNRKKQSKYVVNLSLDIPMHSDRFAFDKPVSGEFTIFPTNAKKNSKLKVVSARTTQQAQSRKITILDNSNRINSARNDRKIPTNKSSDKSSTLQMKHTRNTSCLPTSKSPSRTVTKYGKQVSVMGMTEGAANLNMNGNTNTNMNLKVLRKKIICAVDDDIIQYSNPSSQLRREDSFGEFRDRFGRYGMRKYEEMRDLVTPPLRTYKLSESDEIELLSEIKKVEKNAIQKKNKLNFDYMYNKIRMQACARKIQRAWRNYKTKRLLHTYSHSFSIKLTNKMQQNSLHSDKKILNVKSCGYKNGQNQLKMQFKNQRFQPQPHHLPNPQPNPVPNQQQQQSSKKTQIAELQKQLQLQQIQKWQELIKQLRKNKDVEQILHKAQQNKEELESRSYGRNDGRNGKEEERLLTSIQKIQDQGVKKRIQEALSSLGKDGKEKNQGEREDKKGVNLIKINTFDREADEEEEQPISPKSEIVQKITISYDEYQKSISSQDQPNQFFNIQLSPQFPPVSTPQKTPNPNPQPHPHPSPSPSPHKHTYKSQNIPKESPQSQTTPQKNKLSLCKQKLMKFIRNKVRFITMLKYIQHQVICQVIYGVVEKEKGWMMSVLGKDRNKGQGKQGIERIQGKERGGEWDESRQEGVCTNLQSIKDYLQNLIAFIFEQHPEQFIQAFNTPINPTPKILQKHHSALCPQSPSLSSSQKMPSPQSQPHHQIMRKQLFDLHWQYASQLIYFERKFDDQELEYERIENLKIITKTFFRALFDGFNQCLEYQRNYGIAGKPYPWQTHPTPTPPPLTTIPHLKPKIKSSFKILSEKASIFCGMLVQDKCKHLSTQIQQDIKQQRMNVYLNYQVKNQDQWWQRVGQGDKEEEFGVVVEVCQRVFQEIVMEVWGEIGGRGR